MKVVTKTGAQVLICFLIGYVLGNLNPAFIICRRNGYDVRNSGSRNAGASNALILSGKKAGAVTAIIDMAKATSAWYISSIFFPSFREAGIVGGVSCTLGHMYPAALGFKGGKGLSCLGGVILAYSPKAFCLMLGAALVIAVVTNYISIVTVSMSFIWPVYYGVATQHWIGAAILLIPFVPITWKHIENFQRIKTGEELKLRYLWDKNGELQRTGHADD